MARSGKQSNGELPAHNPAADATPPSVPHKQARGFTTEEIARLLAAAEGDAEPHCILALLLVSGLRRSELLGLTLEALDLEAGTLTVPRTVTEIVTMVIVREITKTKLSRRTLSIPAAVVLLLRAQKARVLEQALAWGASTHRPALPVPGQRWRPMRPFSLTERLAPAHAPAGVKGVQPTHGWRHASATLLIAGGADVKTTQSRLGHSIDLDHAGALHRQSGRARPRRRRGPGGFHSLEQAEKLRLARDGEEENSSAKVRGHIRTVHRSGRRKRNGRPPSK